MQHRNIGEEHLSDEQLANAPCTVTHPALSGDDAELVARYKRWLLNIGFDGGGSSPPMLVLARIETLSAEIADQHVYLAEHPDKPYPTRKVTKDEAIEILSKQLADARRLALEEAAGWHDEQAKQAREEYAIACKHGVEFTSSALSVAHRHDESATAIRNLIGEKVG